MQIPLIDTAFVVVDIETTGLSPEKNRVTEVACVLVRNGEIVDKRRTLVNPEQFIPARIQEMTGISNAMVLAAPKGGEIFPEIRNWFPDDATFVAHNVSFDYSFLDASFGRHGLPALPGRKICTLRLARRLLADKRGWSLGNVAAHFGVVVRGRHTALGDAEATAKILIEFLEMLQEEHGCETLEDLLSFQYRTIKPLREVPKHIRALEPTITALPHVPGVYTMLNRAGETLYIGKAKDLRERVGSYFRPGADHTTKIRELVKRVRRIEVEETGSELQALLLESRLIKENQPPFNTAQKRWKRHAFLRLEVTDSYPKVDLAMEIQPDGSEYYGPFRDRGSVETVIDTINRLFKLRQCDDPVVPDTAVIPCFYHQIERCGAPCASLQNSDEYRIEVDRVRAFLSGSEQGILSMLESKMTALAEELRFEEAAELRDRLMELQRIFTRKGKIADSVNANNVLIFLPADREGRRQLFLIKFGRLVKRIMVGRRFPVATLRESLRRTYFTGALTPPRLGREEIHEIRIIAGYLYKYRESGEFVYVEPEDDLDTLMRSVLRRLGQGDGAIPENFEGDSA